MSANSESASPSPSADNAITDAADTAAVVAARSRRRVCNLSPSQVEKKRAIDRTNQQHWRQKKRMYIAELEAEVARLQASLDESQAKLRVYEVEGNGETDAADTTTDEELLQDGRLQLPSPARSAAALDANAIMSAVSALSALSSLPPNDMSTTIRDADSYVLDGTVTLPLSSGISSNMSSDVSNDISNEIGWPLTLDDSSVPRHDLLAQQQQTQSGITSELSIYDTTQSFQLFASSLDSVTADTSDGLFSTSSQYNDIGLPSAMEHQYYGQQRLQQQYEQQMLYNNNNHHQHAHRYNTVFGAGGAPSPLMTGLSYMPYYLQGRTSAPGANVPDWMALPLNLPVSTEIDKLVLITAQMLAERYSVHELNQPDFPSIEGHMPHLRTLNLQKTTAASTSAAASAAAPMTPDGLRRGPVSADGNLAEFIGTASKGRSSKSSLDETRKADIDAAARSRPFIGAVASHVVWISPLKNLAGRLSFLYKIAIFLRWCLCPTRETYAALPEFMRPTPLQRRIPHPVWVDFIVWPDARDNMIRSGDYSSFELFRFVIGNSITMNWPYPDDASTCISRSRSSSGDSQRLTFNPLFEAHLRNIDNYSITQQAANVFPMLSKYVRVSTDV
ncbi:bZIP transcription factor [Ophiostoma piceae UAMH 11346]|uniref:BZIP transcription factor n=1 Tax=Ophiostoma piceae (strain UAMH 11346) TaxID=1262450 RepID=S3C1P4_OPHP1|nr:bZIP transcription factor [Ophiostoma piceae UAMH 11346]